MPKSLAPDARSAPGPPPSPGVLGPGALLALIREDGPMTRRDLADRTGLGRSTVAQRVEALLGRGLLVQESEGRSTGGRPPSLLRFNPRAGLVLAADLGATHSRVALADLSRVAFAERVGDIEIAAGPETVLNWLEEQFDELLREEKRTPDEVSVIGIGLPGPVEFATGRPVNPPIMPGWDGYPVADRLAARFNAPVLVDNDVNIMALGEHSTTWSSRENLLLVKVGTGIGSGIITNGRIYRGSQGAAGDIGHIRVAGYDDVVCQCGNVGCLESVAGGRALARQARLAGLEADTSRDVVQLVRDQNVVAIRLVRQAGRVLGEVLAHLVNALNPSVIVIAGDIAHADQQLFAGVREIVYQRSTPLATRHLQIVRSKLDDRAGITGAAAMAIEHILSPDVIDRELLRSGLSLRAS
jgi:predicted NBD/HSP70 family sugar kinase